ncbi:MAG: tRNA epoxyqueuosine(34) reductase QueG [Cyanobacteria bacterium]|nr:tRNA epoxyqueuosine(34) reductase QueG [Cyanobacteriota bacterium]
MQEIKDKITQIAQDIGFNDISFIDAKPLLKSEQHFLEWRQKGFAADMNYLLKDNPINARPQELLKEAKTIIMLTANYYSPCPPRPSLKHGRIAAYATGLDYHKVLKNKIQELINHPSLEGIFKNSKFFTDAVPLLEKSFAKEAGLGFRGKNTLLLSKETGSFNFIAEILTDLDLSNHYQTLERGNDIGCAKCTRCIDICPTNALPNPYQLDARKCISYQTIENREEIPQELHQGIGEWLFGCDLCQTICPYNKKSKPSTFKEFEPESGFGHWLYLPELLDLELGKHRDISSLTKALKKHKFIDEQALPTIKKYLMNKNEIKEEDLDHIFQIKFARTPLLRTKRKGLIRNAKIVLKNSYHCEE